MCIFDYTNSKKTWRADPEMSLTDNLFFGSVHFCQVFFMRYKINRHNNENDFDDMAADCSIAVYESAKKNIDKWDKQYRLDQYIYYRAWSVVGNWLRTYFTKKQRELLDVKLEHRNRIRAPEFDVGTDEIESSNYEQGTRYTVWRTAPLNYEEKKLTEDELEYVRMVDDCVYEGLPIPTLEDFDLEDSEHKATIQKILGENYVG